MTQAFKFSTHSKCPVKEETQEDNRNEIVNRMGNRSYSV